MSRGGRWYLVETTHAHWPGSLPWRSREDAERGAGYDSELEASREAMRVTRHYNATRGQSGPQLRAAVWEPDDAP